MRFAETDQEIRACAHVLAQLRDRLTEDEIARRAAAQMREGYRLAYVASNGAVAAVAGFRVANNLAWGRHLYVDDLVTDAASRSRGHGADLLQGLIEYARANGCAELHLDSGVHRDRAHRFYFARGFAVKSFHFSMDPASQTNRKTQ
ncbi:MAG: GNAT family N-acetyltransferase [Deltaproteobacteria bacterium]|nr:GNAT family N-acetyltransferase [Deltaproteobacteria bacterium]